MGTRHLIMVVLHGQTRIAQYGQWDGYPNGQGVNVLRFVRDDNMETFAEQVTKFTRFGTYDEIEAAWGKPNYGHLSRDTGANILKVVMQAAGEILLQDHSEFAAQSLFCEWGYVVDLDKRVIEVYKGFRQTPVPEGERFVGLNPTEPFVPKYAGDNQYFPIQLVRAFSFDDLPNDEDFVTACEPHDDEKEEDEAA